MARRPIVPTPSEPELIAGVDVGYGNVKALRAPLSPSDMSMPVVFPSLYGLAHHLRFRAEKTFARYPGDQLTDDQGDWWVGDLAKAELQENEVFGVYGREDANDQRVRLAKAALGKLLPGQHDGARVRVSLATGLPVAHMDDDEALRTALMGEHLIKTDQTHFIADIHTVSVMPQPVGAIYSQALTPDGRQNMSHRFERVGVIDAGQYTIDAAVDEMGEYKDRESDTAESGLHLAYEHIADLYEHRYGEAPTLKTIEQIMRTGCAQVFDKEVHFEDEVKRALAPTRAATLKLMRGLWKRGASLNIIFIVGGGGPLVEDEVTAEYGHAHLLHDSQIAIAQGYLNYAIWDQRG